MAKETHISSIVVHARPEATATIRATVESLPGIEVHTVTPLGKMILILETDSEADIVTNLNTISLLDGVYAATLVFHSVEDLTDSEEAPHEALTT